MDHINMNRGYIKSSQQLEFYQYDSEKMTTDQYVYKYCFSFKGKIKKRSWE